jgi:Flp pilus assembly protein TadD
VTNLRKALHLAPHDTRILSALGFAEAFSGNRGEARRIENELLENAKRKFVSAQDLAVISLALGKKGQALEYLEQAYNERCPWMPFLSLNPLLNSLKSDPQFTALTEKVGFPL